MKAWMVPLLVLAAPQLVRAQCVSYHYPGNSGAQSIGIHVGASWQAANRTPPNIGSAIAAWANACANMPGNDFPNLHNNSNGEINISVEKRTGMIPVQGAGCAYFDHDVDASGRVVGGTIAFYDYDSDASDCTWNGAFVPSTMVNIVAHEIGHVLGLANSSCSGYRMSAGYLNTAPHQDECGWVDEFWTNTAEQQQESCDLTCADPPCVGNPPACDIGGGAQECTSVTCFTWDDPLVLDLDGNGIVTSSVEAGVEFDVNGDGILDRSAWTVLGEEDAFLYYDYNKNGVIDSGQELFGDATLLPNGERASHGFEALAAYDRADRGGDADGVISPSDRVWGILRLWVDRDHDGKMVASENYSLSQARVHAIDLSYRTLGAEEDFGIDGASNLHVLQGVFLKGNSPRMAVAHAMHDIFFRASFGTE